MIEALKPCPFCGGGAEMCVMTDNSLQTYYAIRSDLSPARRYHVIWRHFDTCPVTLIGRYFVTEEAAIAAVNRRASPSWSTEPPTEEGWYCVTWNDSIEPYRHLVNGNYIVAKTLIAYVMKHPRGEMIVDFFNSPRSYPIDRIYGCEKERFVGIRWHKIDVPDLPEEHK